jgi:hypothetical protein
MASESSPSPQDPTPIQARLRELAHRLREAKHLEPDSQRELAELADELAASGDFTKASSTEVAQLLDTSARVIDTLHRSPQTPVPATLRERLAKAIYAAEARAPVLAGVAHRLLDVLADLGI